MEVKSNIGDVAKDTKKLTTESKKAEKGVSGIGTAFKGIGTAIKAAGIGLVVGLLAKLMEVFSKNQTVLDTFNTAMIALEIAFNDLFTFLSNNIGTIKDFFKDIFENPKQSLIDFGDAIKDNLIERFMSLLDVFGFLGKALKELMAGELGNAIDEVKKAGVEMADVFTGVDGTVGKVKKTLEETTTSIINYTKATTDQAAATTASAKAAIFAGAEFQKLNAQFLKDAELQRQIRDDETKTFAERIEANNKLKETLEEQQKLQREQVQIAITAAEAQVALNANDENKLALLEAQNVERELEETITGQLSEQKTNAISLEKELLQVQKELRAEGLSGLERELQDLQDAYDLKLDMARKSGVDTTAITKQFEKEKEDILQTAADKEKALDKLVKDGKVAMAQDGLSLITAIAGESSAIGKAAAIAQTTITGIQSVSEAFKSGNANVPMMLATGGAYGFIQAGLAGAFSAVQLAKIGGVGGGGGGGGGGSVAAPSTPAPQMMSGAFELSGGVAPEPVQAFVVTDEMTNSQNQLANIRRRATI